VTLALRTRLSVLSALVFALLLAGVSIAPPGEGPWSLPLALGAAMLVSWWAARLALTPLARVAVVAKAIDIHTLGKRLPTRGARDELDAVANAFNETLARLEHSVAEMRQFSTALAHELRTPLAALRGGIELMRLRGGHAEADDHAFVSQIEEIDRLRRLIDQILTLSCAENGQIPLAFIPVDLSELARSLVEQLEPVAQANALTLRSESVDKVFVSGDADWLRRLIINLIDNALKFTPPGGAVIVRVSRDVSDARLAVEDTGIGLTTADAQHVFERFFRADPSRSSTTEGAGIGLSLVRWIAERHHGSVTVASRPGRGSTFTLELPLNHN
jgi:heavy metal sensor kinase